MNKLFIGGGLLLFLVIITTGYVIDWSNKREAILAIVPIVISTISPLVIGAWLNAKFEKNKKTFEKKFESYSELINLTKPFLSDPSLNFEEAKKMAQDFIEKYNNEILPFAPKEVVIAVQNFLYNSGTKFANNNSQTEALFGIIKAIRNDLGLGGLEQEKIEFHTINEEVLKEKYKTKKKIT